jgi:UDP-N-acetylmuramoyl-tripeptide--D-alanyl-D-alanine ligase
VKKKIINLYLLLLRSLAKAQLVKNKPLIIGITGSAGKSSCTQLIASTLNEDFNIKYTKKGNSETGIPFEILNIPVKNYSALDWLFILFKGLYQVIFNWENYSILIIEMGIDSDQSPKDMRTLLKIVSPDIGVLLNANSVHLGNFKGPKEVQTIANEKARLLFDLPKNGLAILNEDQKEFKKLKTKIKAKVKTFSLKKNVAIKLVTHHVSLRESFFEFVFKDITYTLTFKNKLIFKEAFGSFASTFLIAEFLGVKPHKIIKNIEKNFKVLPGRGIVFSGINGSTIIDSSYNSSLNPTSASLKLLSKLKEGNNRTIAILGDMRELGQKAKEDHQALEKVALKTTDLVYTVGPLTTKYFKDKSVKKYPNAYSLINDLKKEIKRNDIILVKGSQNTILLEIIVLEILKNKQEIKNSSRQTPYWDKQRENLKKEAIS